MWTMDCLERCEVTLYVSTVYVEPNIVVHIGYKNNMYVSLDGITK